MEYNNLDIEAICQFNDKRKRKYRYYLSYIWNNKKPLLGVILFNPSIADTNHLDPTHARLINKFCDEYGGIQVLNLISFISTNPKELNNRDIEEDVKVDIIKYLNKITAKDVLLAWGSLPKKLLRNKRHDVDTSIAQIINKLKKKKKNLYQLNEDKIVHPLIRKQTSKYIFNEDKLIRFS